MSFYWKVCELLISISPITCGIIFLLLQNDKDVFMESLICRLDDNCEKLLICKLDLECKKTLHFDSEISMSQVSVWNLDHKHYIFPASVLFLKLLKLSTFPCFHTPFIPFLQGVLACGKIETCFAIDLLQYVMSSYEINVTSKDFWNMDSLIYFSYIEHANVTIFFEVWLQILIRPIKGNRGSISNHSAVAINYWYLGSIGSFFRRKMAWAMLFSIKRGRRFNIVFKYTSAALQKQYTIFYIVVNHRL